ncbi:hypothetical protein [Cellulosimicrobium sp. CUA-896]|nr:hypothetical protein [Cellulosimicrobium sp. CUA-896]
MSKSSQRNDGYDPSQDPDADPASLNPRTGAEAQARGPRTAATRTPTRRA